MFRLIVLFFLFINLASTHAQNLVPYRDNQKEKWGYKNKAGKIVLPAIYDDAADFSDGVAGVAIRKKVSKHDYEEPIWGFIDATGKLILPFKYRTAHYLKKMYFNEGLAIVTEVTETENSTTFKYGFINKKGIYIVPCKYQYVIEFKGGFAAVNLGGFNDGHGGIDGGLWGLINKEGNEVVEPKYTYLSSFSGGFAIIKSYGKYGFVNTAGVEVIKPIYLYANDFVEGLAKVTLGTQEMPKYGFIDKTGKEIVAIKYDDANNFSEGLAAINIGGKWERVSRYSQAMEIVGGKWGYVDKTGMIVIPCKYKKAGDFKKGKATVELNGQTFSIDKNGNGIDE